MTGKAEGLGPDLRGAWDPEAGRRSCVIPEATPNQGDAAPTHTKMGHARKITADSQHLLIA